MDNITHMQQLSQIVKGTGCAFLVIAFSMYMMTIVSGKGGSSSISVVTFGFIFLWLMFFGVYILRSFQIILDSLKLLIDTLPVFERLMDMTQTPIAKATC